MKTFKKINLQHLIFLFYLLFIFLVPFLVFASDGGGAKGLLNIVADSAGYEKSASLADIVAAGINGFLALIGIIFLVYIIYAGYLWLGASGNEEQVKKAKEQIQNAIIGLIVVVGSYAIVNFVLNALFNSGGPANS